MSLFICLLYGIFVYSCTQKMYKKCKNKLYILAGRKSKGWATFKAEIDNTFKHIQKFSDGSIIPKEALLFAEPLLLKT